MALRLSVQQSVCSQLQDFIVECDSEIRKAALSTLAVSYKVLGDDIWRFVGKLSSAQKGILDEKFKWKAREMDKHREGRPGEG
jgi:cytoskeleton-associated protein 5